MDGSLKMISEQTKQKFAFIVKNMSAEQRNELQSHLASLPDNEKWAMAQRIVDSYESAKGPITLNEPETVVYEPEDFNKEEPEEQEEHEAPKRKLKKSVKNTIAAIIAAAVIIPAGIIGYMNRDKIMGKISGDVIPAETTAVTAPLETSAPTPSPTPTVTPTPEPTRVPLAADHPDLTGLTVVIDPGHQETTDTQEELYASWLSATKPRCTCGAAGIVTGTSEYALTLDYSLIIADYLEQCGATVILTRDSNDVNISNQERAQIAVDNNADVFLRIHTDAAGDSAASGVRVYIPDSGNYTDTSSELGNTLAGLVAEAEGLEVNDVRATSLYTGLNYANTIRSFQISLGFLSNSDDEAILTNEDNMANVAQAISVFCSEFMQ